jgi:hypothetical protein
LFLERICDLVSSLEGGVRIATKPLEAVEFRLTAPPEPVQSTQGLLFNGARQTAAHSSRKTAATATQAPTLVGVSPPDRYTVSNVAELGSKEIVTHMKNQFGLGRLQEGARFRVEAAIRMAEREQNPSSEMRLL